MREERGWARKLALRVDNVIAKDGEGKPRPRNLLLSTRPNCQPTGSSRRGHGGSLCELFSSLRRQMLVMQMIATFKLMEILENLN